MKNYEYNYCGYNDEFSDKSDDKYNDESDDEYNYKENSLNIKNSSNEKQTENKTTALVNYNSINNYNKLIDFYSKKGYQITFRRTQEVDKDGKSKFNCDVIFAKHPKTIVKVLKEYTSQYVDGTKLEPVVKLYKTGIIFKDIHFYTDYVRVPCQYKYNYERTATYYSDGTINYNDWREI